MNLLLSLFSVLISSAMAQKPSPLCENLSRFTCAPGSYNDGTGTVKSGEDLEKELQTLRAKHNERSKKLASEVWADPKNEFLKDKAIAALGLKNSPDCTSTDKARQAECQKRALEGLANLIERSSSKALNSASSLQGRAGNLKELSLLTSDHKFKSLIERAQKEVSKDIVDPKLDTKIREKIFPQVVAIIAEKLKNLPINDEQKKYMISKVKSIHFDGTSCTEMNGNSVDAVLIPNAFYNREANIFKFCYGLAIQGNSEFMITNVIAHELGHSIDPCGISSAPADTGVHYSDNKDEMKSRSEYPIPNLISCLRDSRSIGAKVGVQNFGMGSMAPGGQPPPQQQDPDEAVFCRGGDQIGEAFSDWLASEVTPIYIEKNYKLTPEQYQTGYSNIWRSNCATGTQNGFNFAGVVIQDPHSAIDDRIDKMILVQPKVREQMKCPPTHSKNIYCDPNQAFPTGNANPQGNPNQSEPKPKGPAVNLAPKSGSKGVN